MKNYLKMLIVWMLGNDDSEAWEEWLISMGEKEKQSCLNCRFKNHDHDTCWAGTYWAGKGQNVVCYEGEVWEPRVSDKTKQLKNNCK